MSNSRTRSISHQGAKNGRWKGGLQKTSDGYINILLKPKFRKLHHRHIMETKLKRALRKDEVVHHKNGIKTDNRICNLEVMDKRAHDSLARSFLGRRHSRETRMIISRKLIGNKNAQK